jgi:hypothetical protein
MPANLTPQYMKAEKRYRSAREPVDRLDALEEMFRLLPKHKGTDKLQADLKKKMSDLRREIDSGGGKTKKGVSHRVDACGHPQVVVVGPPNAGKSALISALSGVDLEVAEYPYTTRTPAPAMMRWEGAAIQLVDTPPIFPQFMEPWVSSLVRAADRALFVLDLTASDLLEGTEGALDQLEAHKTFLRTGKRSADESFPVGTEVIPTLMIGNKLDGDDQADGLDILSELYGDRFEMLAVSAKNSAGLEELSARIFMFLDKIRIFPKPPGKKIDRSEPILLDRGSTVLDLATSIHREMGEKLKSARLWGSSGGTADGRWVARDQPLQDLDVIELEV